MHIGASFLSIVSLLVTVSYWVRLGLAENEKLHIADTVLGNFDKLISLKKRYFIEYCKN